MRSYRELCRFVFEGRPIVIGTKQKKQNYYVTPVSYSNMNFYVAYQIVSLPMTLPST